MGRAQADRCLLREGGESGGLVLCCLWCCWGAGGVEMPELLAGGGIDCVERAGLSSGDDRAICPIGIRGEGGVASEAPEFRAGRAGEGDELGLRGEGHIA